MRLLFAGTPEAALPSLRTLLDSHHEVVGVLTQPDSRTGRGRKLAPSPVKALALEAGLPVLTPSTLRDDAVQQQLRDLAPDAAPVVAYGNLIPQGALDIPRHGWINLHFSLLPQWRAPHLPSAPSSPGSARPARACSGSRRAWTPGPSSPPPPPPSASSRPPASCWSGWPRTARPCCCRPSTPSPTAPPPRPRRTTPPPRMPRSSPPPRRRSTGPS